MATPSEVKAGLDDIAKSIRDARQAYLQAKSRIQAAQNQLDAIPVTFSAVLTEIDGYTGDDAFELFSQAEKAKLTTEFLALKAEINTLIDSAAF